MEFKQAQLLALGAIDFVSADTKTDLKTKAQKDLIQVASCP